jgi:hypothetical protein
LSSKRNQNSLLFLTTLGVYLGLLVVGGSAPQVFAHSATTRNFEINEGIEIRDDLDTNPDDERSPVHMSLGNYLDDVEQFIIALRGLQQKQLFEPANGTFSVGQSTQLPCVAANRIGSYTVSEFATSSESARKTLEWFSKRLTDGYSLGDCLPNARLGEETHNSKFDLKLDQNNFTIEVAARKNSPSNAHITAEDLVRASKQIRIDTADLVRASIYEHTTFRSEKDQVFILTRLPRADLVSLLSKSA